VVRVKLTKCGSRLVRRVGGVTLTYRVVAWTDDGRRMRFSRTAHVLPPRATAVASDRLFARRSRTLRRRGRRYVRRLAARLADAERVVCTGYTDSRGPARASRRFGRARAGTVCARLRRAGVHATLVARSAGSDTPAPRTGRGAAGSATGASS
jgi:outer membrane protein OmpA-like peptidoglycan-associated protein